MKKSSKVLPIAAVAILLATTVMAAVDVQKANPRQLGIQKGTLRGMFRPGVALRGLNLSQQQKDQIKGIVANNKDDIKKAAKEYARARLLLRDALVSGASAQDLKAAFDGVTSAEWSAIQLRAKITSEIKPVLTPDQQARLQQRLQKVDARIQNRLKKLD